MMNFVLRWRRKTPSRIPFLTLTNSCNESVHDYIIVGAGSAGCVLANRLTEQKTNLSPSRSSPPSVHLFEAGPSDQGLFGLTFKMPAAMLLNVRTDKHNWYYHTAAQQHMNQRVMYWPRGRVLGGSSSINAMVYMRGHAMDYDRWEREGAAGWNFANCLPYFRRAQTHQLGADDFRGGDGPLFVSHPKMDQPLHQAWLKAGQEAGYGYTDDLNGFQQEGVGPFDMTIKNGERCSSSVAYLHSVQNSRPNLTVTSGALVTKILFNQNRAVGIEYVRKGQIHKAHAEREVLLSGGVINSPQLLMLSGIGDADRLRAVGVQAWHHLPGVGQNLQDHLQVCVQHSCDKPVSMYKAQAMYPHVAVGVMFEWLFHRTGPGATSHLESGGFVRSTPSATHPDIQFHFLPSTTIDHGRSMHKRHAYQVTAVSLRPTSRGQLLLRSSNPQDVPIIDPNYMATEHDHQAMRASIRLTREIFAQPSLSTEFGGYELAPGLEVCEDPQLDEYVRQFGDTCYHPSSTCRMGSKPEGRKVTEDDISKWGLTANDYVDAAVTKSDCKVWGLEGLRVIDASIMPSLVSGNLNAPVIMMAERASDIILGDYYSQSLMLPTAQTKPSWSPKHPEKQRDGEPMVKF